MIASPKINVPPSLLAMLSEKPEAKHETPSRAVKKSKREPWDMRFTLLILGLIFGVNFLLIFVMEHFPQPKHTRLGDKIVTEPMALASHNIPSSEGISSHYKRTETYVFDEKDKARLLAHIKKKPDTRSLEDPLNLQAMKQRTLAQIIERKRAAELTPEELAIP